MKVNQRNIETESASPSQRRNGIDLSLLQAEDSGKIKNMANAMIDLQQLVMLELTKKLRELGITHEKYHLLRFLDAHGGPQHPVFMSELSVKIGITTAAVTGLIDRLEKLNYVVRKHHPSDRRKVFVQLTGQGEEVLDEILREIQDIIVESLSNLEEEEVEDFQPLFQLFRLSRNQSGSILHRN